MGRLVFFNRRLPVSTDDLYLPVLYLFILRTLWTPIISYAYFIIKDDCRWGWVVRQYLFTSMCIGMAVWVTEGLLCFLATRGTIVRKEPRRAMTPLCHIDFILVILDFGTQVMGAYSTFGTPIHDDQVALECRAPIPQYAVLLLHIQIIWALITSFGYFFVVGLFIYSSRQKKNRDFNMAKYLRLWQRRIKWLCSGPHNRKGEGQKVILNVSRELADYFKDVDWAPTDIAVGLILLKREQKMAREAAEVRQALPCTSMATSSTQPDAIRPMFSASAPNIGVSSKLHHLQQQKSLQHLQHLQQQHQQTLLKSKQLPAVPESSVNSLADRNNSDRLPELGYNALPIKPLDNGWASLARHRASASVPKLDFTSVNTKAASCSLLTSAHTTSPTSPALSAEEPQSREYIHRDSIMIEMVATRSSTASPTSVQAPTEVSFPPRLSIGSLKPLKMDFLPSIDNASTASTGNTGILPYPQKKESTSEKPSLDSQGSKVVDLPAVKDGNGMNAVAPDLLSQTKQIQILDYDIKKSSSFQPNEDSMLELGERGRNSVDEEEKEGSPKSPYGDSHIALGESTSAYAKSVGDESETSNVTEGTNRTSRPLVRDSPAQVDRRPAERKLGQSPERRIVSTSVPVPHAGLTRGVLSTPSVAISNSNLRWMRANDTTTNALAPSQQHPAPSILQSPDTTKRMSIASETSSRRMSLAADFRSREYFASHLSGNGHVHIFREDIQDVLHFAHYAELVYVNFDSTAYHNKIDVLIHVSPKNDLYMSPYMISFDHEWRAIVVSIRGTHSAADVLVDLSIDLDVLEPVQDEKEGKIMFVHSGILGTARNIYNEIVTDQHLANILLDENSAYADYGIVVCGHSLGAGVGALVTYFLRKSGFLSAICYAYEPPGGLISEEAVSIFESFCVSIVTGDDLVPRLCRNSMDILKTDVDRLINLCDDPKFRVFGSVLFNACSGPSEKTKFIINRLRRRHGIDTTENRADQLRQIRKDTRSLPTSWRQASTEDMQSEVVPTERTCPPMFMPGRILYIEKLRGFSPKHSEPSSSNDVTSNSLRRKSHRRKPGNASLMAIKQTISTHLNQIKHRTKDYKYIYVPRWADKDEFQHIIISRSMMTDHSPFGVLREFDESPLHIPLQTTS
ncbi:hypothetical protein BASA50_008895 [Batrachochytrium salamandrivorans]|uniref:sn-1-specific diacylglycerol lipase n=1 Tax=Batrachochytrium salamandrivorans TaxID=1357716 RepID=A0ABQ8F2Q3_9FUNG|nr:hypothetical protein BASA50_008895 [Batrachochytrium salamandrivorans]